MPQPKPKSLSHHPTDTPLSRARAQAAACRAANLDDWTAGWVAGILQATEADALPIARWRTCLDTLIDHIVTEERMLLDAGLDPDDPQMLSEYVDQTVAVIN